jgi:tRNA-binding EMAP/Myf-like protein
VAKGQKVVVATVGATLFPTIGEPIEIKKAKIRGQVSEGMICALDQLTLATNARPRKSIFFNIASWVLELFKLGEIPKSTNLF